MSLRKGTTTDAQDPAFHSGCGYCTCALLVRFNGQEKTVAADEKGRWRTTLDLADSPAGPFELRVNQRVIRDVALNRAGAGIDQQLRRIKAVSLLRRPGAMHPVAV